MAISTAIRIANTGLRDLACILGLRSEAACCFSPRSWDNADMQNKTIPGGAFNLGGDLVVSRMGYGAMQLAGPHVFGPPKDRDTAIAVLREALALGITHIDTSDFYGPHVTNQIIKEALHPYPSDLHIVTKVGARRDERGGWPHARKPAELRSAVHDNLRNLALE